MADPKTYFGLSCPNGGQFYICENITTEFIGCCTTNPCTSPDSGKCPTANLRAASFSAGKYFALKQQDCDDAASIKIWYTCADIIPPFMGCCASNPCAAGLCTPTDLRPAKLSSEPGRRASFLHPGGTDPSTTTSSSSATSTATNTAPTSTTSSTNLSGGAIGGICAAATVVLIMIVGIAIWYTRKKGQERAAPTPADVPTGKPLPFFGDNGYRPRGKSHTILSFRLPVSLTERRRVQRERSYSIRRRNVVTQPTITSAGLAVSLGV